MRAFLPAAGRLSVTDEARGNTHVSSVEQTGSVSGRTGNPSVHCSFIY